MAYEYNVNINGIDVCASYSDESVNGIFIPLLRRLTAMQAEAGRRILVFLAAPPGTGKSTLCSFLGHLAETTDGVAPVSVIGMDGFHRFQEYLLTHYAEVDGREVKMVDIKGNPITFDVPKFEAKIREVVAGGTVKWPQYDRMLHDPVEDAIEVTGDIVILEGNYLLLDLPEWNGLRQYADYSVCIRAELDDLRPRLIDRKAASGTPRDKAEAFVESSDLRNARICNEHSVGADLWLTMKHDGEYIIG